MDKLIKGLSRTIDGVLEESAGWDNIVVHAKHTTATAAKAAFLNPIRIF
ncbi:MAG: hypothetical protein GX409_09350 [candidate division Zixibacteria bacterium]|nr:hypothetical protein [candidate division Zixibacteria bacterium]